MSTSFFQTQTQKQQQQQRLTPQQLLTSTLMELPIEALYERVEEELMDNTSLEKDYDDEENTSYDAPTDETRDEEGGDNDSNDDEAVVDLPASATDDPEDDNAPDFAEIQYADPNQESRQMQLGETLSFYDLMMEQMGEYDLTDHEEEILNYLIGSLGDDGLLRTPLDRIEDELSVYHNIQTSVEELTHLVEVLQRFDPPGVGARTLQECLLIQARRSPSIPPHTRQRLITLLEEHFDDVLANRWQRIRSEMSLTPSESDRLVRALRRLNPRPGSAMGEVEGKNVQQITPDFIVETDYDGHHSLTINRGNLPTLKVSDEDQETLRQFEAIGDSNLSASNREARNYLRACIDNAQSFIQALDQRQQSMTKTMKAIMQMQRPYFDTGDETQLRPMTMEQVAAKTGLHISIVSRVCSSKWVDTPYGMHPLKWFFTSAARLDGAEVSVRTIMNALQELVDNEDPTHPLSDEAITRALKQQGYEVARRTVAKYRGILHIPTAAMRQQH